MKIIFEDLRTVDFTIEGSKELGEECLGACLDIAQKYVDKKRTRKVLNDEQYR